MSQDWMTCSWSPWAHCAVLAIDDLECEVCKAVGRAQISVDAVTKPVTFSQCAVWHQLKYVKVWGRTVARCDECDEWGG